MRRIYERTAAANLLFQDDPRDGLPFDPSPAPDRPSVVHALDGLLLSGLQPLVDTVPGGTGTSATLTVGAAPTVSAIDAIGDLDFYRIDLVAGHEYQIGMYGYTPTGAGAPIGPTGLPLLDSFLELYDGAGNLITSADGGSDTTLNSANSGFDALLTFTATTTGTYYVNARAFDNVPADGTNGDLIGDYGLYAKDVTGDPSIYQPYYAPSSPLYAIDWGTQVNKIHQTYRNPDGDEGTRVTGNAQAPVDPGAALGHPGKNVISIYFAQAGDVFVSNDLTNPGLPPATITATGVQAFEHTAVMTALGEFAKVADVAYVEVTDRTQADFIYTSYIGTPGPGVSLLGSMSPPGESDQGLAQFNSGDYRWNSTDLQQGGFSFVTLIHEFGHGHGLAHPHDNGGHSGIMNGVTSEGAGVADYTTGDYAMNQGVYTMMSYEDGWQSSPYGNAPTDVGYGYLGGLMALDIAAIQDKYGVNEEWATGNDTYVLRDENSAGTYYTSIWDAGGTDAITYSGARNATIDLRPATLQYEYGGGGRVSFAYGIFGGFTIANGVTIENANSGSGSDVLTGNAVANVLNGGAGDDALYGGGGNDTLIGGAGNDWLFVEDSGDVVVENAGEGADRVFASVSYALAAGAAVEMLTTTDNFGTAAIGLTGNGFDQAIYGNEGANVLTGGGGTDDLIGFGGNDWYVVDSASDRVYEASGGGNDRVFASASYTLGAGAEVEMLTTTDNSGTAAIDLTGNSFDQAIFGNAGDNVLTGGGGTDDMIGFGGNDWYYADSAGDHVYEAAGGGTDRVLASTSYTLAADAEVEILTTTDNFGHLAIDLTGSGFGQAIYGNDAPNVLDGKGGVDDLIGNGGNDIFAFTSAIGPGTGNVDTIHDFVSGVDRISLDDAVFTALTPGVLPASAFVLGTAAQDADDRIVYDAGTGHLLYDADGAGGVEALLFATLTGGPALVAADIFVA